MTDLETLDAAIETARAAGCASVEFNGRKLENWSLVDLLKIRRDIANSGGADTALASTSRGVIFNKISSPGAA